MGYLTPEEIEEQFTKVAQASSKDPRKYKYDSTSIRIVLARRLTDSRRRHYNQELCLLIASVCRDHPHFRFSEIVDETIPTEEPWDTYTRIYNLFYGTRR